MKKTIKIGIYTFTAANNYGAVLQAYALKQYLCYEGNEAHCVDYRPRFLTERYEAFSFYSLRGKGMVVKMMKQCVKYNRIRKKNLLFNKFRKNCLSLIPIDTNGIDVYIVGSDQVWNYNITRGDRVLLGNIPYSNGKIIAYAASMEQELGSQYVDDFKKQLNNFATISVREYSLMQTIKEKYGHDCITVVDPTFLLTKRQWMEMEKPYSVANNMYLFMYGFGFSKEDHNKVEMFAKEKGLQVIKASSGVLFNNGYANDICPQQFVWLVNNAQYVVTNSFHGTAFSIIFGKDFLELKKHGLAVNKRVVNLLRLSGIDYQERDYGKKFNDNDFIKITNFPISFCNEIERSKAFLNNAIKEG